MFTLLYGATLNNANFNAFNTVLIGKPFLENLILQLKNSSVPLKM